MEILVIYERGVLKPLQKINLKEGTKIKIIGYTERDTESLSELARQFAGIGGYKEPIDSEKLHQIKEELWIGF
ncbi:MAG: antitoxin family protein [Candidatus Methanofastidiosia archaeon]|jgi:predicted DNA-binding antitoxin AbrB/MazE fold protein